MPDKTQINEVIKDRHQEASEVKHCFTDFAFKGLLLATAFFAATVKFYPTEEHGYIPYLLMWLFCGIVVIVLLRILRIGFHKYSTANRNYGYVLHLDRTYDYEARTGSALEDGIREVGWEEAMFAWRVIQPILYDRIYKHSSRGERVLFPLRGVERYFETKYHWWNTEHLMNFRPADGWRRDPSVSFHPGSYLQKTQNLIHFICTAMYVLFSLSFFAERSCMYRMLGRESSAIADIVYVGAWCVLTGVYMNLVVKQYAQRQILEKGLLSIQSCAVVWRLVVLSHLKAVKEGNDYKGYTQRLVASASFITERLQDIHETVMINNWDTSGQDMAISKKCRATTKSGHPCRNSAASGDDYCYVHRKMSEPRYSEEKEFEALRAELLGGKRYVFERPILIITAALAAVQLMEKNHAIYLSPVVIWLLSFNLWFTVNRIGSIARIVAYIQVVLEDGDMPWHGWETSLRRYRKWLKDNGLNVQAVVINEEAVYDNLGYYPVIFWVHIAANCLIAILAVVYAVFLSSVFTLLIAGTCVMSLVVFICYAWKNRSPVVSRQIEQNRKIWREVIDRWED